MKQIGLLNSFWINLLWSQKVGHANGLLQMSRRWNAADGNLEEANNRRLVNWHVDIYECVQCHNALWPISTVAKVLAFNDIELVSGSSSRELSAMQLLIVSRLCTFPRDNFYWWGKGQFQVRTWAMISSAVNVLIYEPTIYLIEIIPIHWISTSKDCIHDTFEQRLLHAKIRTCLRQPSDKPLSIFWRSSISVCGNYKDANIQLNVENILFRNLEWKSANASKWRAYFMHQLIFGFIIFHIDDLDAITYSLNSLF